VNETVTVKIDREGLGPGDDYVRGPAMNDAVVAGVRGDQGTEAPLAEGDASLVDDPGIVVGAREVEVVVPTHEVVVGDIRGGRQKPVGPNLTPRPHGDAVLVDQPDIAVGPKAPVDPRWLVGNDAIEGDGVPARLHEAGKLAALDAEAVPVDDGLVTMLPDHYSRRPG